MNWVNFENGIQARVVAATGLATTKVIWENQNVDRPARPYVSMNIESAEESSPSQDVITYDNPVPTAGSEILIKNISQQVVEIRLTAFTTEVIGDSSARALLQKVRMHLSSESAQSALCALVEPIGVLTTSNVQDASIVLETEVEGRAILTVRVMVGDENVEANTYIETVVNSGTVLPP